jgi:hypothetical protein
MNYTRLCLGQFMMCGERIGGLSYHGHECLRIAAAVKYWNARPIEDALLARAEKAEDIIHGMFPLWIAAMSYAEHGRAADLDRIRNYYNGRDNPLTSEQLHYLFSIEDKK